MLLKLTSIVVTCVPLTMAGFVHAEQLRAHVEGYGLYRFEKLRMIDDPSEVGGRRGVIGATVMQLRATDEVPLQKGVSFGVELFVDAPSKVEHVNVRRVIRFPPPGIQDPITGKLFREVDVTGALPVRQKLPFIYSFDEAWELIPGEWKFEFWIAGNKVAEKTFSVTRPQTNADSSRMWPFAVANPLLFLVVLLLGLVATAGAGSIVYGIRERRSMKGKYHA